MILRGLSPSVLLIGLGALAATLLVLHLLRVRLRRETVDSLMFFRMLGQVQKPRMLLGLPSRWLALLLALLAGALAWTASGRPALQSDDPSRIVLLDSTVAAAAPADDGRALRDAYGERALELIESEGLGPHGRVVAFGAAQHTLLAAGEPDDCLAERLEFLPTSGTPDDLWRALRAAAADLDADDEIVVIGGPTTLPAEFAQVPLRRVGVEAMASAGITRATLVPDDPAALVVEVSGAIGDVTARLILTLDGQDPRSVEVDRTTRRARFDELPLDAGSGRLELTVGDRAVHATGIQLPDREPIGVRIVEGAPRSVRLVVEADPRLRAAERGDAVVACTTDVADAELASLVIAKAQGEPRPRQPRLVDDGFALSLRDRAAEHGALPQGGDGDYDRVFVEDALSGAPLVAARGSREIHVVDWLVDGAASHRDVPLLIGQALRRLGQVSTEVELSEPLVVAPGPEAPSANAPTSTETGEEFAAPLALPALLIALALLLVGADIWLHARGRIP